MRKEIVTKKADDLRLGKVVCVLKNRNTGRIREVEGSVARVPYNSKATKETKRKFGKNLVYFMHYDSDELVCYRQK